MLTEVKGLILKTVDIKESDRLVVMYTEEMGIVTALAKGARSLKSRKMSAAMQFCYGSYVLFGKGDKLWIKEASLIESFFDIRETIEGLALATYIAEVVADVGTAEPDVDILRLALNSLYAIAKRKHSINKIKAAFEIRLASILGFMPDVVSCARCGGGKGDFFLDVMAGAVECYACHAKAQKAHEPLTDFHESSILRIVSEGARVALAYCIHAPLEKLFSFNLSDEDMRMFAGASECYLLNHLERGYKSLDFYNEVKI